MWNPAPAPQPISWAVVRASYPHAYRALFETGGGTALNARWGEDTPHWFSVPLSEEQLLNREYDAEDRQFRRFELSDLVTFFAAYQFIISVRGLRTSHPRDFPATWSYGYTLRTPTALVGRCHPDGPYPFASHAIAQQAAFLMAFHLLDPQLRK